MPRKSSKKSILLVEDEPAQRNALRDKLKREGYETLSAANGEEGLQMALDKHPDLILLDIIMPIMDGLTMLERLRENDWGSQARIIFLTNLGNGETADRAAGQSISAYLVKTDWKISDIIKKIKEILPD